MYGTIYKKKNLKILYGKWEILMKFGETFLSHFDFVFVSLVKVLIIFFKVKIWTDGNLAG
jgi:hypothetical protein